jgi:hypothetical protein
MDLAIVIHKKLPAIAIPIPSGIKYEDAFMLGEKVSQAYNVYITVPMANIHVGFIARSLGRSLNCYRYHGKHSKQRSSLYLRIAEFRNLRPAWSTSYNRA